MGETSGDAIIRPPLHLAIDVLRVARAPLFFAVVAFFIFSAPSQTRELYRILAVDDNPTELIVAIVGIFLLSAILCYNVIVCARWQQIVAPFDARYPSAIKDMTALAVCWLPILGVLVGVDGSALTAQDRWTYAIIFSVLAMLLLAIGLPFGFSASARSGQLQWITGLRAHRVLAIALGLACLPLFVPWTIFGVSPADAYAALLGPVGIVCLFAALGTTVASLLSHAHNRNGRPAIALLLVPAIFLGIAGWSDNYEIPTRQAANARLPDIRSAFEQWYKARPDLDFYKSKGAKYPVFIVSAEGGGMAAAYHAAIALARVQDKCPTFAGHIFAISAVSGGALGAAVFQGLAKAPLQAPATTDICQDRPAVAPGRVEQAARAILSKDFLSPMLGTALFGNIAQYWFPLPISAWDRSQALERRIVTAWDDLGYRGNNQFRRPFRAHWDAGQGSGPALLLNVTVAQLGQRAVIAPFHFYSPTNGPGVGLKNLLSAKINQELHSRGVGPNDAIVAREFDLATAVGLSARFPWVSSAGWLADGKREWWHLLWDTRAKRHIIDGAYSDNSGVATLLDLHQILQGAPAAQEVEFFFITLFEDDSVRLGDPAFGELLGPLGALLTARKETGYQTILRFWEKACRDDEVCRRLGAADPTAWFTLRNNIWQVLQEPNPTKSLPLGWRLAKRSQRAIDERLGDMSACPTVDKVESILAPGCAAARVRLILSGTPPSTQSKQVKR